MNRMWPTVFLGEVLRPVSRSVSIDPLKEYNLVGVQLDGRGPFLRETLPGSRISAKTLFEIQKGDFVYSRLFAWRGAFGIVREDLDHSVVSAEFPIFKPEPKKLDINFLNYWFHLPSTLSRVLADCTGSTPLTRNRFKENFFLKLVLPLPPLEEQRRIVARIEELAAKIEEAKRLRRESADTLERLTRNRWRELFKVSATKVLGDFVSLQSGYAFKSDWFTGEGIKLVRNVNIGHGQIVWSEVARIPESRRAEFQDFELHEEDLLISLDRPLINTGIKVARVSMKDLPCLLLQRVGRVIFKGTDLLPEYVFGWLRSPNFADAIDPGRSNGIPHISPKDIERIPFDPPGVRQQSRVVEQFNELETKLLLVKRVQQETSEEMDALLPSVLDKAFKGEL